MLGVFSINSYIGLKDGVLAKLQPAHQGANFVMALIDLVAASILLFYGSGKRMWILLAGVAWPAAFLFFLLADVESRMCLFTNVNCFASVNDSFQYLILGNSSQGWLLWSYTIPTAIFFQLLIIGLSLFQFKFK